MMRDMFGGENAAVAMADDDGIDKSSARQILRHQRIVFDTFGNGLISAADAFAAVKGAHRIMTAAVEGKILITQSSDMRREKTCGADIEIHLIAVAIHRRAFARANWCVIS